MLVQLLITIGAAQAISFASLNLLKKNRKQADYLLSLELLLLFLIAMIYNYHEELQAGYPNLPLNAFVLGFLAVPVFYLYIKSATRGALPFVWKELWHFIPFVLVNLLLWFSFYQLPFVERVNIVSQIHEQVCPTWYYMMYFSFFLGLFPFYLYRSMRLLGQFEHCILTRYSYIEDVSLSWLQRFLWGMIIVWASFIIFEVVANQFLGLTGSYGFQVAFLFMVANVFYLGIYGVRQKVILGDDDDLLVEEEETAKYQLSGLTEKKAQQYLKQLSAYMEKEKPYLEARITIADLAQRAGIPVNYLSQIINRDLEQNFFDFINAYRVEEFKKLLNEPDNRQFTLLSLAHEAGFNSKSTFNAIFKKITGLTPSEYAKDVMQNGALGAEV
ncbi:MAG: hypothetical protein DHS20C18_10350 [Saprospiraceae bacterium]|nr:MAG: hypothetical protein DHS20C18_10350 [Saprospiraceae bacterium]